MNGNHTKSWTAFALTAILALGLIGGAVAAAGGGVLDFVLGSQTPTNEQKNMVQPVGLTREKGGVKTTLTDALFDGQDMSLALTLASDQKVFVILESVTVNGIDLYIDTHSFDRWLRNPVEDALGTAVTCGLYGTLAAEFTQPEDRAAYDEALLGIQRDGQADVVLRLSLLTPNKDIEIIEALRNPYDMPPARAWDIVDESLSRGMTPLEPYEPYTPMVGGEYPDAQERDTEFFQPVGNAENIARFSNMRLIDTFDFSFSLTADVSRNREFAADAAFTLKGARIDCRQLRFTPLSTTIEFLMIPDGMTIDELENTYPSFYFYDDDQMPLDFQETFTTFGSTAVTLPDGTRALHGYYWLPPLKTLPDTISFVPFEPFAPEEILDWEHVVTVSLNK